VSEMSYWHDADCQAVCLHYQLMLCDQAMCKIHCCWVLMSHRRRCLRHVFVWQNKARRHKVNALTTDITISDVCGLRCAMSAIYNTLREVVLHEWLMFITLEGAIVRTVILSIRVRTFDTLMIDTLIVQLIDIRFHRTI